MQRLSLNSGDPLVLTLAADARVSETNYVNDHIWELMIGGGEPSSLSIETTYGLRARTMRIFPVFKYDNLILTDPNEFAVNVKIITNYPNFIALTFSPFKGIDVLCEFWVPESNQIAGRMRLTNNSIVQTSMRIDWATILIPAEPGERMTPMEIGNATVLAGKTENLAPLFFMTGGPSGGSGPYPCLSKDLYLEPGASHDITWILSTSDDHESSFEKARFTASMNWNGITAELDMINSSNPVIITGDADWDSSFHMAQKTALGSMLRKTKHLLHPSYVSSRLPDQGYSKRGDGSDYDHLWNGQTPLETYFMIDFLLPDKVDLAKGLLENFLDNQSSDGFIDLKLGLNGYKSQLLATPILASIALKLYRYSNDIAYLGSIFPKLFSFFRSWFEISHDRDQDNIPEWDHVLQTGFEDNPLFTYWYEWSRGTTISKIESPDLCAFLYRECKSLIEISKIIANEDSIEFLEGKARQLTEAVNDAWNEELSSYQYRDRDTHARTKGQFIGERNGEGNILVSEKFEKPVRLDIKIDIKGEVPYDLQLFIHGTTQRGAHRIEKLTNDRFQWHLRRGYATTDRAYQAVDHINIMGIGSNDYVYINSIDYEYQNQANLLPLWAGMPTRRQAKSLIKNTIMDPNRYWFKYGLRTVANPPITEEEINFCESVDIVWNALILEGLINYGYRSIAAELFQHNMKAIILSLKRDHAFRRLYLAENGDGIGEKNIISRIVPIGVFLQILGVQVYSPKRILLKAFNPFPWPVSIKYRGLTIIRQKKNSMILFPNGTETTIRNGKNQIIKVE